GAVGSLHGAGPRLAAGLRLRGAPDRRAAPGALGRPPRRRRLPRIASRRPGGASWAAAPGRPVGRRPVRDPRLPCSAATRPRGRLVLGRGAFALLRGVILIGLADGRGKGDSPWQVSPHLNAPTVRPPVRTHPKPFVPCGAANACRRPPMPTFHG